MTTTASNTPHGASLPLKELSIQQLYHEGTATYEIPIYQRNFAWGHDEMVTLIQDINDARLKPGANSVYYIGTLVTFHRGDHVYEVIDGQQRLTAINLILHALDCRPQNKLVYRARKKANATIASLPSLPSEDVDLDIAQGYSVVKEALKDVLAGAQERANFKEFFLDRVRMIHYQVPKDVDLNHYFEVMNSRGKQLEQHEIAKALLLEKLSGPEDKGRFALVWESCSQMSTYVQKTYVRAGYAAGVFGIDEDDLIVQRFEELPSQDEHTQRRSIREVLASGAVVGREEQPEELSSDTFQPIINFPNFLLVVLKLTMLGAFGSAAGDITLNDKELLAEFKKSMHHARERTNEEEFVKQFGFNLLKAKYLLDNYVVHHLMEEDSIGANPWKLQYWRRLPKKEDGKQGHEFRELANGRTQEMLVQLLSLFEVCFTANQRKNYLLYCLLYLFPKQEGKRGYRDFNTEEYANFLDAMARKFLHDVYLDEERLNESGAPVPGAFDEALLEGGSVDTCIVNAAPDFKGVYASAGAQVKSIPLFVFNYLDYRLWKKYSKELRGERKKEGSPQRRAFFEELGCTDFGLGVFDQFYFSRTRRSLEHFFPQANASGKDGMPDEVQINCFGNYAMIGSSVNSSGSNWSPVTKLAHYLDASGKVNQVSVATLKLRIMMQICKGNEGERPAGHEWVTEDISDHEQKMIQILLG